MFSSQMGTGLVLPAFSSNCLNQAQTLQGSLLHRQPASDCQSTSLYISTPGRQRVDHRIWPVMQKFDAMLPLVARCRRISTWYHHFLQRSLQPKFAEVASFGWLPGCRHMIHLLMSCEVKATSLASPSTQQADSRVPMPFWTLNQLSFHSDLVSTGPKDSLTAIQYSQELCALLGPRTAEWSHRWWWCQWQIVAKPLYLQKSLNPPYPGPWLSGLLAVG